MPAGSYTSYVFSDLIERVYRRVMSGQREVVGQTYVAYSAGNPTIDISSPQTTLIEPGAQLAVDLEIMLVTGWTPTSNPVGGIANVSYGYLGSSNANHAKGANVYIDPKYTRFDCAEAINDALALLSSPANGLYQTVQTTITYNPVYQGYDLGALPSNFNRILELNYDQPYPNRDFPPIRRWKVNRGIQNTKVPSGVELVIYDGGWPGLNINVTASAPFTPLQNLTDDVCGVSGLPSTAIDIPPLIAQVMLTEGREIKRNFIESQPDPRKAQDVPPGAMLQSTNKLELRIQQRISEEAERLAQLWPRQRALR